MREGGRDQLSSLPMLLSLAGQEPFAQHRPRNNAQYRTFLIVVRPIDQDIGYELGRIHEHHADSPELRSSDVWNPGAQLFQHVNPVAEEGAQNLNRASHPLTNVQFFAEAPHRCCAQTSRRAKYGVSPTELSPSGRPRQRSRNAVPPSPWRVPCALAL